MRPRQLGMTAEDLGISADSMNALQKTYGAQLLWVLRNANMQQTTDQAFTKVFTGTKWATNLIVPVLLSGSITSLTAGGLYTAASKTGSAIVGAAQLWTSVLPLTIALSGALTATALNLSLTVGSLSASTADIFVFGVILD